MPNNGAFYIRAEDKNDTNDFKVPGDLTGESPDGSENPAQSSYSIDNKQRQHGKFYYIHIKNGWDVDVETGVNGSSYDDPEMNKSVVEQPVQKLSSKSREVIEDETGHSVIELAVENITSVPSSGTLEIVFQDRYR